MSHISRFPHFGKVSISATSILTFAYVFLCLLSLRYCRAVSSRDPTSFFFDASRAYTRNYSAKRIDEAESFLSEPRDERRLLRPGDPPEVCVGIVTVRRRGDQYVGLTVGSLLEGLSEHQRSRLLLYLRIGNTDPTEHPIYSERWVELLPDRLLTYTSDDSDFYRIREWEDGGWYRNKSIYDFTTLLKECYDSGAEYVAMVEDDTLAVKGWFPCMLQALHSVQEHAAGREWVYLRLFYMESLLGWNGEEWLKYFCWSFVIWASLTGMIVASRRQVNKHLRLLPNSALWITTCVFIPAAIVLHFMTGRQTMWPIPTGVSEMNEYGCCSQGLVFPRSIIPRFLEKTDLTTDWLVDMMVEQIADSQGWSRWVVVPPLLQHIGATSSKGYGFDDTASSIWNFRFEEYNV